LTIEGCGVRLIGAIGVLRHEWVVDENRFPKGGARVASLFFTFPLLLRADFDRQFTFVCRRRLKPAPYLPGAKPNNWSAAR
jgi:hypothetical protein